jgi:predicted HTH transcriptional regulator
MSDFQTEMNRVVQGFVAQITELARRAAIDTLETALSRDGRGRKSGGAALAAVGSRGRGRGAKRTADELDKLSEEFVEFVKSNPGLRIEQINKQLGTSTKDLALPIRKMIAEGAIKVKGQKRSTTYFAGEGGRKKKSKN